MKKLAVLSIIVCLLQVTTGCVSPDDKSAGSGSSSSTSPGPNPTATEAEPLVIQISSKYDTTDTNYSYKFQETGLPTCSATDATPQVTCTISAPEGRLYHSSVQFSYSWRNDKCKLMTFVPYYYRASSSAGFAPPWLDSPIDCSVPYPPSACWGGAGPSMVENFPKKIGYIYFSDPTTSTPQQAYKTLPSAFSKNYYSNRLTCNDLPLAKQGNAYNDVALNVKGDNFVGAVAGEVTYQTYIWQCQDDWYDPVKYQIKLIITDEDSSGTGPDDFMTWKEL